MKKTRVGNGARKQGSAGRNAWRVLGIMLVLLIVVPVYRILRSSDADLFLQIATNVASDSRTLLIFGSLIVVAAGTIISRFLDPQAVDNAARGIGKKLASIPTVRFAFGIALISACITLTFSIFVLDGKPNLIDAMVQLLHARFFAAGHLAGPANQFTEFWQLQNSLVTDKGWVSQYPPGYVAFLALGILLHVPQAVGPFFVGVTVLFTALTAERLLPDDRATARLGVLMLAFSPFLIGLAGAYMNHIGAAAFFSVAVFFATLSLDNENYLWPVLAGLAVGVVFSIRPLTAIVASLVVATIWLRPNQLIPGNSVSCFLRRTVAAAVGILPIFIALGLYNKHFFGSPLRFGYIASQGPLMKLGFHRDPTGQLYHPLQALAYTSIDLQTLSLYAFETPIPAVLLVGLFFIFAKRLSWGERVIGTWAVLPVAANVFYWHHGSFMGPRMLNEATAAWALLSGVAAVGLVRRIPQAKMFGSYSPRSALTITLAIGWLSGILFLGPQRLASYGGPWLESSRVKLPPVPQPALIFVHGGWTGRIAMRLIAHGMRLDSLESVMRFNATCDVHQFALWYALDGAERPRSHPPIHFELRANQNTRVFEIAKGDDVRSGTGTPMPQTCLREVESDTLGIVEVAPLLWQSDLPGTNGTGAMVVRDMGPESNSRLIARYPSRIPMVMYRATREGMPVVAPYATGMAALWPKG